MIIVYDSLTGLGEKFAKKLGYECYDINGFTPKDEKLFLLTRNFNFGEVTDEAENFLDKYSHLVVGVAVNSNRSWGEYYGAAADKIEEKYKIPFALKYEGTGTDADVLKVKEWIAKYL